MDGFGVVQMVLLALAPLHHAAGIQRCFVLRVEKRGLVARGVFPGDSIQPDAADRRHGFREISVDQLFAEAHGFENLRAAVALHGGDAHFGHDFHDALDVGFDVLVLRVPTLSSLSRPVSDAIGDRFQRQVRVDRRAP